MSTVAATPGVPLTAVVVLLDRPPTCITEHHGLNCFLPSPSVTARVVEASPTCRCEDSRQVGTTKQSPDTIRELGYRRASFPRDCRAPSAGLRVFAMTLTLCRCESRRSRDEAISEGDRGAMAVVRGPDSVEGARCIGTSAPCRTTLKGRTTRVGVRSGSEHSRQVCRDNARISEGAALCMSERRPRPRCSPRPAPSR